MIRSVRSNAPIRSYHLTIPTFECRRGHNTYSSQSSPPLLTAAAIRISRYAPSRLSRRHRVSNFVGTALSRPQGISHIHVPDRQIRVRSRHSYLTRRFRGFLGIVDVGPPWDGYLRSRCLKASEPEVIRDSEPRAEYSNVPVVRVCTLCPRSKIAMRHTRTAGF